MHPRLTERPLGVGAAAVLGVVMVIQVVAWGIALASFWNSVGMLALCLMAYVLGLRHALDADHIAAIDNVTRILVGVGRSAATVGLFFALGHSAVVSLVSLVLSLAAGQPGGEVGHVREWTAIYSTLISVTVLILVAPRNAFAAWRIFQSLSRGTDVPTPPPPAYIGRLLGPLLRISLKSWQMLLVGALFGVGFETATAIAVLGLSAGEASGGMSLSLAMIFPLLFTAGMTLVDSCDGLFMERAYRWALQQPRRHATYNFAVTLLSAVIAFCVGVFELLSLARRYWSGPLPGAAAAAFLEDHFEEFGLGFAAIFALAWAAAFLISRTSSSARGDLEGP